MCIRAGNNELETVKNLMNMSLKAVLADALATDIDTVSDSSRLVEDLHMNDRESRHLTALIAEVFDGLQIDLTQTPTIAALLEQVVTKEFDGLLN